MPFQFWHRWRDERALRRRASAFVNGLAQEPHDDDVRWLASLTPEGDVDHARWELRYARRALGLIAAQRDALDDRTASAVARALSSALRFDPNIAADKLAVAQRQLNTRLRGYTDALSSRTGAVTTGERLGRALLAFAGVAESPPPGAVVRAGEMLAHYRAESNASLRSHFGVASLPEDVAPSAGAGVPVSK
jgi:hypothetical protein